LPLSEGGCGVASASDVLPVARLAGVMQFLARAEPRLGFDRQLFVPLATETGLLDALRARLPRALEPLAGWTRTGKVELPHGDVRCQHWWSAQLTQVKAESLLEAATGRDVPRLEAQRAGTAGGWLSDPPVAGQGLCLAGANCSTLLRWHLGVPLLPADCVGRLCPLFGGPVYILGDGDHKKGPALGPTQMGPLKLWVPLPTQPNLQQLLNL